MDPLVVVGVGSASGTSATEIVTWVEHSVLVASRIASAPAAARALVTPAAASATTASPGTALAPATRGKFGEE